MWPFYLVFSYGFNLEKNLLMCGFSTITHKKKEMFLRFELTNNPKKLVFLKHNINIFISLL